MPTSRLKTLNHLPVNIAVLDPLGTIVAVNNAWKEFGRRYGLKDPRSCEGTNYLEVCRAASAPPDLIEELTDLLQGRRAAITRWYPCHAPSGKRWFVLFGINDERAGPGTSTLFHIEATKLVGASTINRLEIERPDFTPADHAAGRSLDAAFSLVMPALLSAMQAGAAREEQDSGAAAREEARTITNALTRKQFEVLLLLGTGKSNAEIGAELSASPNTIKLHVSAILKRLSLQTRAQAVALAAKLKAP